VLDTRINKPKTSSFHSKNGRTRAKAGTHVTVTPTSLHHRSAERLYAAINAWESQHTNPLRTESAVLITMSFLGASRFHFQPQAHHTSLSPIPQVLVSNIPGFSSVCGVVRSLAFCFRGRRYLQIQDAVSGDFLVPEGGEVVPFQSHTCFIKQTKLVFIQRHDSSELLNARLTPEKDPTNSQVVTLHPFFTRASTSFPRPLRPPAVPPQYPQRISSIVARTLHACTTPTACTNHLLPACKHPCLPHSATRIHGQRSRCSELLQGAERRMFLRHFRICITL